MKKCYINGLSCISSQPTFSGDFLTEISGKIDGNVRYAIEPSYKDYIPSAAIRRMAKVVKMGTVSAINALKDAQINCPQAILTGTGLGCLQDSEKFLKAILDNDEQYLTPTSFIQSTHNTVAGQIALHLSCKGTNLTYVNGAVSFESALLEAQMQIEESESKEDILVGGIDEITSHTLLLYELANILKGKEEPCADVYNDSEGVIFSEGATFFVISGDKTAHSYAELVDIAICNRVEGDELEKFVVEFLQRNNLSASEVDISISGRNSDSREAKHFDIFENLFPKKVVTYKQLSGEYYTASAFGMWIGCQVLKSQQIPQVLQRNTQTRTQYKHLLLYNQFQERDHSLILLKNV